MIIHLITLCSPPFLRFVPPIH